MTVRLAAYVPGFSYTCETAFPDWIGEPSPTFHSVLRWPPSASVEVIVNWTVSGAGPEAGTAVNEAWGAWLTLGGGDGGEDVPPPETDCPATTDGAVAEGEVVGDGVGWAGAPVGVGDGWTQLLPT